MQQQQHMASGMGGVRPPPPEYKTAAQAQMMHASIGMGQQARFTNAGPMRRVTQQPMPPSGKLYGNLKTMLDADIMQCDLNYRHNAGNLKKMAQ